MLHNHSLVPVSVAKPFPHIKDFLYRSSAKRSLSLKQEHGAGRGKVQLFAVAAELLALWLGAGEVQCVLTPYLERLHPQGYQCREVRVQ